MTSNRIIKEDIQRILAAPLNWAKFSKKTVLISGANGFLPAYMVETLLTLNELNPDYNVNVIALVRNKKKAQERFSDYSSNTQLSFLIQDVASQINTDQKIDFIIHAASQASPRYYGTDPVGTLSANVSGTLNLLKLAEKNEVESFLYFSSGEVYGEVSDEFMPVKEDYYGYLDPTKVRSCYAESKRMGENMCVSWHHQFGIKTRIVRPFHTYGPKMLLDDGRVYADFVSNILQGQNIQMKSDGSAKRAFCYLSDATIGFFLVLLNGKCSVPYNVGNPKEEHSILELAKTLAGLYPEKNLKVLEMPEQNNTSYLKSTLTRNSPDIGRISELGWSPAINVKDGFKRTIESYL